MQMIVQMVFLASYRRRHQRSQILRVGLLKATRKRLVRVDDAPPSPNPDHNVVRAPLYGALSKLTLMETQ
jgi:hypothetical protein